MLKMFEKQSDRLVSRPLYFTAAGLSLITAATLVWSVFGSLKLESQGVGILVRGKHFITVNTDQAGLINKQYFKLNDRVNKGDLLMSLNIDLDKIKLTEAQDLEAIIMPSIKESSDAARNIEYYARENIKQSEKEYDDQFASLSKIIKDQEAKYSGLLYLYNEGKVSTQELSNAYSLLANNKQRLSQIKQNIRTQNINLQQIRKSNAQSILDLKSKYISTESNILQLKQQIKSSTLIRSPINGTLVSYNIPLGGYAQQGDELLTLIPNTGNLRSIILVGSKKFGRINIGDKVLISPAASPSIRFGYIEGKVKSKSKAPATSAELLKAFGTQEIVQTLLQSFSRGGKVDLPYLVDVDIIEKDNQPVWTLGKQPPWGVSVGSVTSAKIISSQIRPISLLLPFLRNL